MKQFLEIQNQVVEAEKIHIEEVENNITISQEEKDGEEKKVSTTIQMLTKEIFNDYNC